MSLYVYTKPPCGVSIDVVNIERLVVERYRTLTRNNIEKVKFDEIPCFQSEYDEVTHFCLALIASVNEDIKSVILECEKQCFNRRVQNASEIVFVKSLFHVINQLEMVKTENKKIPIIKNFLMVIVSHYNHIFSQNHDEKCNEICIKIPFTFALDLVRNREITVDSGVCIVPCGLFKQLLNTVCEYLLEFEQECLKQCTLIKHLLYNDEDDRIRSLTQRFSQYFIQDLSNDCTSLPIWALEEEVSYFPPCMANLHQILRLTHRLSYESRFQYSSFLKVIGVSLDDNIQLWKEEYSQECNQASCVHTWHEKGDRYTYQIKHLYGKVGSHKDRKVTHDCSKFIDHLGPRQDSGCPFQHNTEDQLKEDLPIDDIEDILTYKRQSKPQKCCALYLQRLCFSSSTQLNSDIFKRIKEIPMIQNPVQFYRLRKAACL